MKQFNQLGISPIVIIVILVSVAALISLGALYLKQQSEIKIEPPAQTITQEPSIIVSQGKPLGSDTKLFLDQVAQGKADSYKNQFEEAKKTKNWITYENEQFGYQFSYPAAWLSPQTSMGNPDLSLFYKDLTNQNSQDEFYLTLKNAFELDKNSEANYCDSINEVPRCEVLNLGDTKAVIDWGKSETATVTIAHPTNNLQAVFELNPTTDQAKNAFKQILLTFKFN